MAATDLQISEIFRCKILIVEQTKIFKFLHLNFILIQHRGRNIFYQYDL